MSRVWALAYIPSWRHFSRHTYSEVATKRRRLQVSEQERTSEGPSKYKKQSWSLEPILVQEPRILGRATFCRGGRVVGVFVVGERLRLTPSTSRRYERVP